MNAELVELFWGKAGPKEKGTSALHPALYHMIDVGMVAREMAERSPATTLRGLSLTAGLSADIAARRIGFLVALHDLGKISPGFQNKRPDLTERQRSLGYLPSETAETDHACVTLEHMRGRNGRDIPANAMIRAIAAHHGRFHPMDGPPRFRSKDGVGPWVDARTAAIQVLAEVFEVEAEALLRPGAFSTRDAAVLAGITTVADWIGSASEYFPPEREHPRPLAQYAPAARQRARQALRTIGWDAWHPWDEAMSFTTLFPKHEQPNALQQLTAQIGESVAGPCLAIIEAPMGLGKTEAALILADTLVRRLGHSGLYDALPTQSTSNQMFGRVQAYLICRLAGQPANLHLLHGLAAFDDAYAALLAASRPEAEGPAPPEPGM